jgi:hypothetical protein
MGSTRCFGKDSVAESFVLGCTESRPTSRVRLYVSIGASVVVGPMG